MPKAVTKHVFRYLYYDTDFELEESYLSSMGRGGFVLTGFTLNSLYKFRKEQPCNLIYKMDFREKYDEDYLQLVLDAGWLLAAKRRDQGGVWYYFYKINDGDNVYELFTDTDSKLGLLRRTQKRTVLSLIIIPVIFLLFNLPLLLFEISSHIYNFIAGLVTGLSIATFVLSVIIYMKLRIKIKQIEINKL